MSGACLYMPHPENTVKGRAQSLFRRWSYDLWRRELNGLGINRRGARKHSIVDVGCGPGFLICCLEKWYPNAGVIGVDANEELLEVARTRCRNVELLKGDACKLPLADGSADVVFGLHVIEHLPEPSEFLAEARRVLRPGGLMVLATPNAAGLGALLMKDRWRGYSDPTHIALHGASFWRGLIADSGFWIRHDGTTGFSGIPWLDQMPLGLIHWVPTFIFGFFPWNLGEAYICTAVKEA